MVALAAKQNEKEQIVLRAGNSGTYDMQNRELVLIQEANPNNISWKTRELYFEETTLSEVVELLNKVYHTRIEIANPDLATCSITVTFKNQTLESVLNVLGTTLDLEITSMDGVTRLGGPGCVE
jgi:ferric-dicitrate binding protein FerR (iron transport regulator)